MTLANGHTTTLIYYMVFLEAWHFFEWQHLSQMKDGVVFFFIIKTLPAVTPIQADGALLLVLCT